MKQGIMIIIILITLTIFAESRSTINISGTKGDMLFEGLSNNYNNLDIFNDSNYSSNSYYSCNSSNNSSCYATEGNKTINISRGTQFRDLSGKEGLVLLHQFANASNVTNLTETYVNLTEWGSGPKSTPPPPDSRTSRTIEVLRMNHMGY